MLCAGERRPPRWIRIGRRGAGVQWRDAGVFARLQGAHPARRMAVSGAFRAAYSDRRPPSNCWEARGGAP